MNKRELISKSEHFIAFICSNWTKCFCDPWNFVKTQIEHFDGKHIANI